MQIQLQNRGHDESHQSASFGKCSMYPIGIELIGLLTSITQNIVHNMRMI